MSSDALTGSIDLAATLAIGKPVHTEGLLAISPQLLIRRAEKLDTACTSLLAQALDRSELLLPAVLDPHDPEAIVVAKLEARLPFVVDGLTEHYWTNTDIERAKNRIDAAPLDPKWVQDLCYAAFAIGIASPRYVSQAITTARAASGQVPTEWWLPVMIFGCRALNNETRPPRFLPLTPQAPLHFNAWLKPREQWKPF